VITDRGKPIADIVPHRGLVGGVPRERFVATVRDLRALNPEGYSAAELRAELNGAVDPYLDGDEPGR
jgi:antitoxin (DNA-binding transcriptional repressor) of toxin-antitoxin stability system